MTPHHHAEGAPAAPAAPPPPGRPVVLESMPPGTWTLILGACLAVLAPLFGFLVGTTFGPGQTGDAVNPLHLGLFVGVIIGGIGTAIAVNSGWRLLHRERERYDGEDGSGHDDTATPLGT